MPRSIASLALIAALAASPLMAMDTDQSYDGIDPEMYADMADANVQDVEWVIRNNPTLLDAAVSDALRRNPGVVKEIIRDTLLRNPELIITSLQEFQRQQAKAGTDTQAADKTADRAGGVETISADLASRLAVADDAPQRGNPDGTITLVEFSDYNCPHCRTFSKTLERLIEDNPNLRVIHREWPILGQDSMDAARIALAAREQGKYEMLHKAFMAEPGKVDAARAYEIAEEQGLDMMRLRETAQDPLNWAHVQDTASFAQELSLRGTPALVIGDQLARGAASAAQIQPLLDAMKVK